MKLGTESVNTQSRNDPRWVPSCRFVRAGSLLVLVLVIVMWAQSVWWHQRLIFNGKSVSASISSEDGRLGLRVLRPPMMSTATFEFKAGRETTTWDREGQIFKRWSFAGIEWHTGGHLRTGSFIVGRSYPKYSRTYVSFGIWYGTLLVFVPLCMAPMFLTWIAHARKAHKIEHRQ